MADTRSLQWPVFLFMPTSRSSFDESARRRERTDSEATWSVHRPTNCVVSREAESSLGRETTRLHQRAAVHPEHIITSFGAPSKRSAAR